MVLLALVIMVSKVHRVPVVSFTLAHGRVCKSLKPMYMPDWLPKFMWWPLWRLLVFAMARSEFKQLVGCFQQFFDFVWGSCF